MHLSALTLASSSFVRVGTISLVALARISKAVVLDKSLDYE